jgi:ribosomal protein S18 acetylase RimI-like enzyme
MEKETRNFEKNRSNVLIHAITQDAWKDYEYLRHEMLRSDPEAFPPQAYDDLHEVEEVWRRRIEQGIVLIAYDNGSPVGMVRATFNGESSRVWNMYAQKEYRGAGIGKKLMGELMVKIKLRGVKHVDLEVEDTQILARMMYENIFGFKESDRVPNERDGYMITMQKTFDQI